MATFVFGNFSKSNVIGRQGGFRDSRGRFLSDKAVDDLFTEKFGKAIGEAYRRIIVAKLKAELATSDYKSSQTGTLVRAIETGEIKVTRTKDKMDIAIKIPSMERTRPKVFARQVNTTANVQEYFQYYFGGRRAIATTGKHMVFMGREGKPMATRYVAASKPHDYLLKLSSAELKEIFAEAEGAVKNGVSSG